MKKLIIKLIKKYQSATSNKNPTCKYIPTCSNYAIDAYKHYNFFYATILTIWRVLRCNPFSKGGYDPIPKFKTKDNLYINLNKEPTMENLIKEYNLQTKKYKKWVFIKLIISIIILTVGLIFTIIYYNEANIIKLLFWLIAAILFAIFLVSISMIFYVNEKPLYQFLYPEIFKNIFLKDDVKYNYEPFPTDKDFLKKGKLFSKSHSSDINYKLTFEAENNSIDIYNINVYSKSHKSSKPIFDGIYMVFHVTNSTNYQLRTKGVLKYKNSSLELIEDNSRYQVFGTKNNSIPNKVSTVFNKLNKRFYDHIYISGVKNQIHIAIDKFNHQHKTKNISQKELDLIKDDLEALIDLAYELNRDLN
ncbi:MAG: membrane protein insertion efficiency factor YidD [Bacillota bacterium]